MKQPAGFVDMEASKLAAVTDTGGGLPCYNFESDALRVSVTKDGGLLCSLSNSRTVEENKLSQKEALTKARGFLQTVGISSVKESYYITADGVCTFNFAWQEAFDDSAVTCYPDLIKVGVALGHRRNPILQRLGLFDEPSPAQPAGPFCSGGKGP